MIVRVLVTAIRYAVSSLCTVPLNDTHPWCMCPCCVRKSWLLPQISSLDATLSATTTQLQDKTAAVSELRAELARAQAQHELQLQDRTDIVSQLQDDLTRLRTQKEREREGERRKEEDLKRSLAQSEQVRQSLLVQVEKNGQELERLTERLAVVQGREGEAERCRAEAEQLKKIVSWSWVKGILQN